MARGRMLSTTIAIDRRLNSLSVESQLLFLMTVPHLDRDGLIAGDAPLLASRAIPRRPEMHPHIEDFIQEWIAAELAIAYDTDDTRVLFFPGFRKNQSFQYTKEGASQFPPPPGYLRAATGLELDNCRPSANLTLEQSKSSLDELQTYSRASQAEGTTKRNEDKQNEPPAGGSSSLDPDFAAACDAYHANIGMLTPILSDKLKDNVQTYSAPWVVDAIGIATQAEHRSLSYVEGILKKWKRDGRTNTNGHAPDADDYNPYAGARRI